MTDQDVLMLKRLIAQAISEFVDALRTPRTVAAPEHPPEPVQSGANRLITIKEAAQRLGITYYGCYAMARENRLPVVRVGRLIRVSSDKLENFIQKGGEALPGGWKRK